jgi:hypothetical protein
VTGHRRLRHSVACAPSAVGIDTSIMPHQAGEAGLLYHLLTITHAPASSMSGWASAWSALARSLVVRQEDAEFLHAGLLAWERSRRAPVRRTSADGKTYERRGTNPGVAQSLLITARHALASHHGASPVFAQRAPDRPSSSLCQHVPRRSRSKPIAALRVLEYVGERFAMIQSSFQMGNL